MEKRKINNIDYCFIENTKFKTNTLSIFFKDKINKKDYIMRKALSSFLLDRTAKYDTPFKLTRKTSMLYSSSVSARDIVFNDYSMIRFSSTFIRSKYLKEDISKQIIELLYEIIYNPYLVNNEFDNNLVKRTKNVLLNNIKKREQSFQIKAREQALNTQYKGETITFDYYQKDDVNFSSKDMYDYYLKMIQTNEMLIVYEGDEDIYDKLNIFSSNVENKYEYIPPMLSSNKKDLIIKKDKTKQNNLCFIYEGFDRSDAYTIKNFFFTMMLGGGASSLLFQEVREKNSLAYSISSTFNNDYKIMMINGGVKLNSLDKTIEIINEQLERLKNEDLSDLLNDTKETYLNGIYSSLDTKGYLTNRCCRNWLINKNTSVDDIIKKVKEITTNDIKEIANKVEKKLMYVIQGDLEDESK